MQVDRRGTAFTAGWESFVPWPYDDKAKAVVTEWQGIRIKAPPRWQAGHAVRGTLTAGYGHTDKGAHPLKIAELVQSGRDLSKEEALEILQVDLADAERSVNRLVKVPLSQGQFNTLCDFTHNCGAGTLAKSTLLARLNRGDYAGARAALDLYVMSKGERLEGLVRRRDAEQQLWDERSDEARVPHPDTDYEETPKGAERAPASKGMLESRTVKGAIAAAGSAVLPTAGAVMKATTADPPAPAPTETITKVLDHTGRIVDTVKSVQEVLPDPPKGFWQGAAHMLADPYVAAALGIVALGAIAFIVFERWRKLHYEGV